MKRRIKKKPVIILCCCIALIFLLIYTLFFIFNTINYHKTYEYKFLKLGYKIDEFQVIDKLNNENKDYLLTLEYNENIIDILNEKYFLEKNLKEYLDYYKESDKSLTDVVAIVNVGANNDWYTNTKKTDISKNELLLTNKFYYLDNSYNSSDMVSVSNQYSYGENQMLTSETFNAFIDMYNAAKEENLTLIINSSYRSYEDQEDIYNYYKEYKGENYADTIAAHAGFSEHQTGMAVDIQTYGSNANTFEEFEEFEWLQNNAYKYGFILRYPKDKEYLTGYTYESWHYRYVGIEAASYIYENNITFDEYYAYFVE